MLLCLVSLSLKILDNYGIIESNDLKLEQEVSGNSWLTVPADQGILFHVATNDKLTAAGQQLGIDIDLLTAQAGHA